MINGITRVGNTRFIDHDSGEELKNVVSVEWSHRHDQFARATVTMIL